MWPYFSGVIRKSRETFKLKSRQTERIASYYPGNIGLSRPANIFDYEFLISSKNVPYTQNHIVNTFIQHGAMLLTLDSSINAHENSIILAICCNLEHADLGPMEFAVQVQTMKFVISAEYCEMRGRLFGRLGGITFNNKCRAVALPSIALINLGRLLAKETDRQGHQHFTKKAANLLMA
jgi:hypothetical protein